MAEKEYIEREALIAEYDRVHKGPAGGARKLMVEAPTADVVEVKHGKWGKEKWTKTHQHICSRCHATVRVHPESCQYKYCPYCGAKMDGKEVANSG